MSEPDPITAELFRNAINALADEMALTIYRTAYSGVLKNIMDYSTALCDARGRLVAQGSLEQLRAGVQAQGAAGEGLAREAEKLTLEEIFLRVVGGSRPAEQELSWLA